MLFAIFESISNLDFLFTCKSISVAYLSAVNFFIPFISFINISSFSSDFIRLYIFEIGLFSFEKFSIKIPKSSTFL